MANPFKKQSTMPINLNKVYGTTFKTKTRKCEGCGASRPVDTNLTTCDCCGSKFMDVEGEM